MSYHNGSVWPHDNEIIAAGLKRYGQGAARMDWLGRIRWRGLRVGDATASLAFERGGSVTGFAFLEQRGQLNGTMAAGQ
jgi:hypothetical protein